jgi:hypothetical protein
VRRLVPAAALALALGLSACGSSGGSTSASTGDEPAGQTQSASALFADMTHAMGKATSTKVTFESSGLTQSVTGSGTFRFGRDLGADLSVTVAGQGNIRIVVLPDAFYLKLPSTAGLPGGKDWIKLTSKGDDALSAAFGPMLDQLSQSFDPTGNAAVLKASTSVTRAGTATVDGVRTTKYTATVDLAKVAAAVGGGLATQYKALATSQTTSLDYAIWVGDDSLPRKFSTTIETPQGDVTAVGTYTDWGAPVTITAPRASEIADSSGMAAPTAGG